MPNVVIGSNVIIAAGSIVTKSVPNAQVWGGVPAKFIMKTEEYAKKCYENRLSYDEKEIVNNNKEEMLIVFNMD